MSRGGHGRAVPAVGDWTGPSCAPPWNCSPDAVWMEETGIEQVARRSGAAKVTRG